jgi:hypothetical protein
MDATYGPDKLHALIVTAALRTRPQRTASDLSRVVDGNDIQRSLDLWHRLGHVRWQMKDLGPCFGSARAMTTAPSDRRSPRGAPCRAATGAGPPGEFAVSVSGIRWRSYPWLVEHAPTASSCAVLNHRLCCRSSTIEPCAAGPSGLPPRTWRTNSSSRKCCCLMPPAENLTGCFQRNRKSARGRVLPAADRADPKPPMPSECSGRLVSRGFCRDNEELSKQCTFVSIP